MNRSKKFLYNSISTGFMQLIFMIVGFITPRIMLSGYGSEINGLVSSITQFISYFNLVEAGLASAAIYALYKPLAEKDHKAINGVVSAARKFYIQSGWIFIGLTLILSIIYPFYVKSNVISTLDVGVLVLVLGVNGALEFFTLSKYRVLLTADQRTYIISIASTIHIIINTVIVVVLAYYKVNIITLRIVALLSIFLRSFILMIYCKRKYKYLNYKEEPDTKALNKRWDALFLQVLGTIQTGTPIVLITLLMKDLKVVSVYTIFNMVMSGIAGVLSIFISGLSASFGDVIAKGEMKTLQKSYKEFEFLYYSLITFVYSITFITIIPFIKIYTKGISDINYNLPIVGFLFVLNGLLYNIKTPQGMLVISAGMYKETKWQTTIQGLIVVIFGVILTPCLGMTGVLIASILSNIYRDIDLLFFIPKYVTKLPVIDTCKRILRMLIIIGVIYIQFMFVNINISSVIGWIMYSLLVGVCTVILIIVSNSIFEYDEVKNVMSRIRMIGGSKK